LALVLTERRGRVAVVTLNRPEKLNALSGELVAELVEVFDQLAGDDQVRVVVLTGAGRAFSAGADLGGPRRAEGGRTLDEWWQRLEGNELRQFMIRDFAKPVIAAVNGYALGRGCELALWCDIVIASEDAKFGEPEIRHGSMVASMIPWLANPQLAKLLILTGDTIGAQEALQMGLVAKVMPGEDGHLREAVRIAERIAKVPAFAVQYNKAAINGMYDAMGFRMGVAYGHKLEVLCHSRIPEVEIEGVNLEQRRREGGVRAFLEARDGPFRDT